ncbi:MAG: hypothetical protein ACOC44_08910 [Promethearchaeia archaeon]
MTEFKLDWNYLLKSMLGDIIIILILNFLIGLAAPKKVPYLRGDMLTNTDITLLIRSVAEEIFWTPVVLGFLMTLIVSNGVRLDLLGNRVDPPEWYRHQITFLKHFPDNLFVRALFIAFISLLIFFPITAVVMGSLEIEAFSFWQFVYFKGIYSAGIAAFIGFLIRIVALGD